MLATGATVVLTQLAWPVACDANIGTLRPLVTDVSAFQSDGATYAAWQVATSPTIVVVDTRTGDRRRVTPPAGCTLMQRDVLGAISTGAGRFLLQCGAEQQAVLDARTGAIINLSHGAGADYKWISTGRLYAESRACSSGECGAVEDLSTAAVSFRRHFAPSDLNRPGAPAPTVCRRLRRPFSRALGIPEPGYFALGEGMLALPTKNDEHVELDRCTRRSRVLSERAIPRDFQLGDGLLTWDTGYPLRLSSPEEALPGPARLISYHLRDASLQEWRLPSLAVSGFGGRAGPFGYSAHAGRMIFWIAATSASGGEAGAALEESTIYAARDSR